MLSFPIPRNAKRHGDDNHLRAGPKPMEKGVAPHGQDAAYTTNERADCKPGEYVRKNATLLFQERK